MNRLSSIAVLTCGTFIAAVYRANHAFVQLQGPLKYPPMDNLTSRLLMLLSMTLLGLSFVGVSTMLSSKTCWRSAERVSFAGGIALAMGLSLLGAIFLLLTLLPAVSVGRRVLREGFSLLIQSWPSRFFDFVYAGLYWTCLTWIFLWGCRGMGKGVLVGISLCSVLSFLIFGTGHDSLRTSVGGAPYYFGAGILFVVMTLLYRKTTQKEASS